MEALNEVIKNKDLVKAKKIFNEMMEDIKKGLVEAEKKIVGASIEEDAQPTENPDDESEDNPSTKNKVDSSQPDDSTQAA